jgi:glycosyltransferase involved in cell wall biosynthesis
MKDYYNRNYCNPCVDVIPISANEMFFNFDSVVRFKRRHELGWHREVIFVYSGSLGLSGINITALVDLFRYALSYSGARLLILSDEANEKIQSLLSTVPVRPSHFAVIRPDPEEIGEWLSTADVGLHALPRQLDSDTRLGTKVVEYWASGLPVIVNNYVGAACSYIQENRYLGRAINFDEKLPGIEALVSEIVETPRGQIQSFAREHFRGAGIAAKYLQAYKNVTNANTV